jgi:alanyl-tRNA synthetase
MASVEHVQALNRRLREIADALGGPVDQIQDRIASQKELISTLKRQLNEARRGAAGGALEQMLAQKTEVGGVSLVAAAADLGDAEALKAMVDQLAEKLEVGVVVLGGGANGKGIFIAKVTAGAVARGAHAGNLVREVAKLAGGGGGGRPEFAQAGARDTSKIPEAIAAVPGLLQAQLK